MITELTAPQKTVKSGTWSLLLPPNGKPIFSDGNVSASKSRVWTGEEKELREFAAKLPVPKTKSERAAEYVGTLDKAILHKYQALFVGLSAQTDDAQKLLAIRAQVPANEAEAQAQADLVAIFSE